MWWGGLLPLFSAARPDRLAHALDEPFAAEADVADGHASGEIDREYHPEPRDSIRERRRVVVIRAVGLVRRDIRRGRADGPSTDRCNLGRYTPYVTVPRIALVAFDSSPGRCPWAARSQSRFHRDSYLVESRRPS